MSSTYTQVFGGSAIYPSDVSYLAIALDNDIELEWPLEATGGNNIVARIIDVTPDGIHTITMPDATNVGVGQTVLFNNLGPDIVTVLDLAGNAILSMNAGEQWQIYLVSNTDPSGQWRTFRYGAATAQAQASALAGPGLTALSSVLAANVPVVPFSTTPLTLTAADRAKAFVWTGALGTVNLPSIATATAGWSAHIRNNGTGDLTIDPAGGETINSGSTLTLRPGDSAMLVTDGVEWFTVGLGQQAVFAFDYTVIAVTGGTYTLSGSELNRISYKFTGTLTSSVTVIVPATIQQYWVNNATTGPFSLEIGAVGGGPPVTVPQGESNIYYCDGTDIVQATTTASFGGTLGIGQGGTGSSTANGALTNLGGTGTGISVFTAASASTGRTALLAAAAGANSDITSLSALSTPLSVLQGGTGAGNATTARSNLGAAASGVNSDITALTASAGIQVGAPTGGAQGVGTINATGLFINGVGVGTGSGSVTSVNASGGTTGLTFTGGPITTSGTLTVGGTLAAANGGTGQTTYSAGQLLIGKTDGTLAKATLTPGSGITITNSDGAITIASAASGGTVTSIGLSAGTTGLTFTSSTTDPITTSGVYTIGGTLAVANGGTGAATASGARLNLGAAASGAITGSGLTVATARLLGRTSAGTGAVEELTVGSGLSLAAGVLSSTAGGGSVTSVSGTGTVNGITLTGTVTSAGNLTLGGTLSGVSLTTQVTGTLPIANGGTGATTAAAARTALGAGTVTSVGGTGTVNGLTLTGTVTGSGNLTLGGTLSGVSLTTAVTGTLPVGNGGTGATTLTASRLVRANGTSAFTAGGIHDASTAEAIRILSSGNVGIGTSAPGAKLQINAQDGFRFDVEAGAASTMRFGSAFTGEGTGALAFSRSTGAITLSNGASGSALVERMQIDASGNVGIGTTSPAARLDVAGAANVSGNISAGGTLTLGNGVSTGDVAIEVGATRSGSGPAYVDLHAQTGQDFNSRLIRYAGADGGLDLINFGTGGITLSAEGAAPVVFKTTATERMRITGAGNVGIGTASPTTALDVNGTINATSINQSVTIAATGTIAADSLGFRGLPQNSQTAAYTLALADIGKHISITTGGVIIPANGTVAFPIGATIVIFNNSGSSQNISITTDTLRLAGTASTGTRSLAQYGLATCVKVAATTWVVSGNVT